MIGTFWLVLGGCGAAVLAANFGASSNGTSLGLAFVGVSLAFGLTARSTSQALFAGSDHIGQLWVFWLAPMVGAALGAALYRYVLGDTEDVVFGHDPSKA